MPIRSSTDILHPYAKNFLEKAGGYDTFIDVEFQALNFLVKNLINANLWDKFKALYPFIGRNARAHSINLVNPNRHNIRWYGNLTHNENGVTGNGGYGNTLCALGWFTNNNIHISAYNATQWGNTNSDSYLIGTTTRTNSIALKTASSTVYTYMGLYADITLPARAIRMTAGNKTNDYRHTEAYGLIMGNNSTKCFVNGIQFGIISPDDPSTYDWPNTTQGNFAKNTVVIQELDQYPVLILSANDFGSITSTSSANIRFASIGYGMTDSEALLFYNIVQSFQKILNRSVDGISVSSKTLQDKDEFIIPLLSILSSPIYRGVTTINQSESDSIAVPVLNITKAKTSGPRRIYIDSNIQTSISLVSFTEI